MASRRRQSSRRDDYYPTRWSEWEWNEQYQRDARYREVSKGDWEWEYAEPRSTEPYEPYSQGVESSPWTPRDRSTDPSGALPTVNEEILHGEEQQADPSNYYRHDDGGVEELNQRLDNTNLGPHRDDRHGGEENRKGKSKTYYSDDHPKRERKGRSRGSEKSFDKQSRVSEDYPEHPAGGEARDYPSADYLESQTEAPPAQPFFPSATGFQSEYQAPQGASPQDYGGHSSQWVGPTGSYRADSVYDASPIAQSSSHAQSPPKSQNAVTVSGKIRTRNDKTNHEKLDARYRVHRSHEFVFGKVFKVLWSEPVGSGGTEITADARYGEKAFHKIRRFLIVNSRKGHSLCIPILTYGFQGVLKYGVHPNDHAVVYSSRRDGPYISDREEGLMTKKPIRIEIKDPAHKLDPWSRLNYAKVYTVEHNVKVLFIGKVADNYEQAVVASFNDTHPPLDSRPYPERPDSPVFSHAQGPDPHYPTAIDVPSSSRTSTWGTSEGHPYAASSYPATTSYPQSAPIAHSYNPGPSFTAEPQTAPSGHQVEYRQEQYSQEQYPEGKYRQEEYSQGQYSQGQYSQGQYPEGKYRQEEYSKEEYSKEEYDKRKYDKKYDKKYEKKRYDKPGPKYDDGYD